MTASGGGKPPSRDLPDDPLLRPASEAGWDDARPAKAAVPAAAKPDAPATTPVTKPDAPAATKPAARTAAPAVPTTTPAAPVIAVKLAAEPLPAAAKLATDAKPAVAARLAATTDATPAAATSAKPAVAPKPTVDAKPDVKLAAEPQPAPATDAKPAVDPKPATDAKPAVDAKPAAASKDTADGPLLPATSSENELRAAVGATPLAEPTAARRRAPTMHDDDHDGDDGDVAGAPHRPRNLKSIAAAIAALAAALAIIAFVVIGRTNRERYLLVCEAERAVPQQGRAFPPWGSRALDGDAWHPLKIAPETRCQARETDDPRVLERWFLAMILDDVSARLTARDVAKADVDDAEALLKQGLLLTRPAASEPETLAAARTEHHEDVERLLGDVTYWRASARLHEAAATLADAAKQFDSAAAQHPRHVSDAAAWASYARKLADQLHAGPGSANALPAIPIAAATPAAASDPPTPASDAPAPPRPVAPAGIALPVEPDKPAVPEAPPAAAPAASVPTGGVLL